jgi:hypothetical protein
MRFRGNKHPNGGKTNVEIVSSRNTAHTIFEARVAVAESVHVAMISDWSRDFLG